MPKDPAVRQRRNRTSTAAVLMAEPAGRETGAGKRRVPSLPKLTMPTGQPYEWLPETRAWWRRLWRSPMAAEFIESDYDPLVSLARLKNKSFKLGDDAPTTLEAEIRQQELRFGLTPGDRKRLQWSMAKPNAPARVQPAKASAPAAAVSDPRALLSIAK